LDRPFQFPFGLPVQGHDQDRLGISLEEEAVRRVGAVAGRAGEDVVVHQLHGVGRVAQGHQVAAQGLVHAVEMRAHQGRVRGRQGLQAQRDPRGEQQGALRTAQQAQRIRGGPAALRLGGMRGTVGEGFGPQHEVQGVARVAAGNARLGKGLPHGVAQALVGAPVAPQAPDVPLQAFGRTGRLQPRLVQRREAHAATVGQVALGGQQVFPRTAVDHRIGAAGIVARHAADRGAVGRGGFRREEQAVRGQQPVEVIADHAGLHGHRAAYRIQVQHPVQVSGDVHH
jgi:hypothetical protein